MQGRLIFSYSLRMLLDNLGAALRISGALYALKFAVGLYFIMTFGEFLLQVLVLHNSGLLQNLIKSGVFNEMVPAGFFGTWLFNMAVLITTSAWISIAWHRYILANELSNSILPPVGINALLSYIVRFIQLGFVIGLIAFVGIIIVSIIAQMNAALDMIIPIVVEAIMTYFLFRFGLILPADAMGKPITLLQSWEASKPYSNAIILVTAIFIFMIALIRIPSAMNADLTSVVNHVYNGVMGWIVMMVGVSILTTIYGLSVEGRKI